MAGAWHFFVSNGGLHALVGVIVVVIVGGVLRALLKAILRELRQIAGYLDTHSRGGLHDVVSAIHQLEGERDESPRKP